MQVEFPNDDVAKNVKKGNEREGIPKSNTRSNEVIHRGQCSKNSRRRRRRSSLEVERN